MGVAPYLAAGVELDEDASHKDQDGRCEPGEACQPECSTSPAASAQGGSSEGIQVDARGARLQGTCQGGAEKRGADAAPEL